MTSPPPGRSSGRGLPVHRSPATESDPVADIVARVGEPAVRDLVARFYRLVPDDSVLAPMYPEQDLAGAEQRLADFLVMRFGGSLRYAETRGHPRLRMRHGPFAIDDAARRHWVECMDRALDAPGPHELPSTEREVIRSFLHGVAEFLRNR